MTGTYLWLQAVDQNLKFVKKPNRSVT